MNFIEKINQFREICDIQDIPSNSEFSMTNKTPNTQTSNIQPQHRQLNNTSENVTEMTDTETTSLKPKQPKKRDMYALINMVEQPTVLSGGSLKSYQMEGLQWMLNVHCYSNKFQSEFKSKNCNEYQINAILADEMGLGKTIQTLALLAAVYENFGIKGPHVIVVPKSTIVQWEGEVKKWCPFMRQQSVIGTREERESQLDDATANCDIILTTYDVLKLEIKKFHKIQFEYMILDEGHRLKSQDAQITQNIKTIKTRHKLLLSGTPIQNDLSELWSLLNVLMPYIFSSVEEFVKILTEQQNVDFLQQILQLFILRREKQDVEKLPPKHEYLIKCPMTQLQKRLYKSILMRDSQSMREAVQSKSAEIGKNSLTNILMQLRKCADHPYLFKGVEPEPQQDGDHLINVSGKMVILQRLIEKIQQRGEKMLVFCQMTALLNIIEDYLVFKHIQYVRIDGSTELEDRANNMKMFMHQDSKITVFLLSTRAGSLGLNLTAANHVVVFQQDFNPQVDLQAVGRAYRILQKRDVYVYRLLSENSVDIRIYERACIKLKLDELIMQNGNFSGQQIKTMEKKQQKNQLMDMLSFGSEQLFNELLDDKQEQKWDYNTPEIAFSEETLNQLLNTAFEEQQKIDQKTLEKQKQVEDVIKNLQQDGKLEAMDVATMYEFEGENFRYLTERVAEEKKQHQKQQRRQWLETIQDETDEREQRDYPTIGKFRFSQNFRPDFFLLDEEFYIMQDKIMEEINNIKQIFTKNVQLQYQQYLEQIQQDSKKKSIYFDPTLPGLIENEVIKQKQYLNLNCPFLENKVITRREFQVILQLLLETDFDDKEVEYGLKRIIMEKEFDKYHQFTQFTSDPVLQKQYAFDLLPPSKKYKVTQLHEINVSDEPDFDSVYSMYKVQKVKQNFDLIVSKQHFINYCKALIKSNTNNEIKQKFQRSILRRQQTLNKYQIVYHLVNIENPLVNMQLLRPSTFKKTFNEINDKFLILFTSIFGFSEYKQCANFINATPLFRNDFWFRSRHHSELKDRVDKLLKLQTKYQKDIVEDAENAE